MVVWKWHRAVEQPQSVSVDLQVFPAAARTTHRSGRLVSRAIAAAAAAPPGVKQALHLPLGALHIHQLSPGHYIAPLSLPEQSGLPFALGLELYSFQECAAHAGAVAADGLVNSSDLLSLQYILDGSAQAGNEEAGAEAVQAGDSLLYQGSYSLSPAAAAGRPERGNETGSSGHAGDMIGGDASPDMQWDLVSLRVLVANEQAADSAGTAAVERLTAAWRAAPQVAPLSDHVVAGIIARARVAAAAAFPEHSRALPGAPAAHAESAPEAGSNGSWLPEGLAAMLRDVDTEWLRYVLPGLAGRAAQVAALGQALGQAGGISAGPIEDHTAGSSTATEDGHAYDRAGSSSGASSSGQAGRPAILKRGLKDVAAFRLPGQTNRLALIFDPLTDNVPFTFGVEIFEAGHKTTPHTHPSSQELFFILAGDGEAFCDGARFAVGAGDAVVFPPTSVHGIDVGDSGRMYCLELMQPNDMFAEFVRAGESLGGLANDDLCVLAALGCGGSSNGHDG